MSKNQKVVNFSGTRQIEPKLRLNLSFQANFTSEYNFLLGSFSGFTQKNRNVHLGIHSLDLVGGEFSSGINELQFEIDKIRNQNQKLPNGKEIKWKLSTSAENLLVTLPRSSNIIYMIDIVDLTTSSENLQQDTIREFKSTISVLAAISSRFDSKIDRITILVNKMDKLAQLTEEDKYAIPWSEILDKDPKESMKMILNFIGERPPGWNELVRRDLIRVYPCSTYGGTAPSPGPIIAKNKNPNFYI